MIRLRLNKKPVIHAKPVDCLGRYVEVGDIVCYPVRAGSSMWLQVGEVLEIYWEDGSPRAKIMRDDNRKIVFTSFPRLAVLSIDVNERLPRERVVVQ